MIRNRTKRLITIAAMILAAHLGGCASDQGMDRFGENPIAADFDAAKDRKPTPETLYAMARLLAARQRDDEAEHVLVRVTNEHPEFVPAYNDLAELMVRKGDLDEAVKRINFGLAFDPSNAVLLNNLGMVYILKEDYARALELFERALENDGRNGRYRTNKAVALGMLGEYEHALATYQQVLPRGDAHYNVGVICEARHDLERAEEEFAAARKLGFKPPKR
jgi:Flp pilus assembly protein TadD